MKSAKHAEGLYAGGNDAPYEVIAAMLQAIDNVLLIRLGTDHDDGHYSIWDRLPQLNTKLLACTGTAPVNQLP